MKTENNVNYHLDLQMKIVLALVCKLVLYVFSFLSIKEEGMGPLWPFK